MSVNEHDLGPAAFGLPEVYQQAFFSEGVKCISVGLHG